MSVDPARLGSPLPPSGSGPEGAWDASTAFAAYAVYVSTIAFRILGPDDELDDLVQDVFLGAHKGLGGLRHPDAIKGWLATLTVRAAHQRLQSRKLRSLLRGPLPSDSHDMADPSASPETRAVLSSIFRALDTLPPRVRVVWSLRYLHDEPLERVAELAGCSLAAVKRRLVKAKTIMDEVLKDG